MLVCVPILSTTEGAAQAGDRPCYAHPPDERKAVEGGETGDGSLRREGDMERQQPAAAVNDRLEGRRDLLVHYGRRLVELQAAHERREDDLELEYRETVPDAVARPVAERDEPAPAVRELAGRRDTAGHEPARGVERGGSRAPDVRVDLHRCERDVEDLARAHTDGRERLARGRGDGVGDGDDVVVEGDALGLRGGGV